MDVFLLCDAVHSSLLSSRNAYELHLKVFVNTVWLYSMVSKYTWYMAEHLPLRYEFRPDETKMKSEMKKAALHRIPSTFTSRLTNTMHFSRKVCYLSFSPFTRRSLFCAVLCGCVQNPRIRKTVEAFTSLWDSSADLKSTEDSTNDDDDNEQKMLYKRHQ